MADRDIIRVVRRGRTAEGDNGPSAANTSTGGGWHNHGPTDPGGGEGAGDFGYGPSPVVPGRIIYRSQRIWLPSGRCRELQWVAATQMLPNGCFVTREHVEAYPALDCSCAPRDLQDVAECARCLRVTCMRHARTCMACGRVCCTRCLKRIRVGYVSGIVCTDCADEIKTPTWRRVLRRVFLGRWTPR